jgi:hypothetical protein
MSTGLAGALDRRAFLSGAGVTVALGVWPLSLAARPSIVPPSQTTPVGIWSEWEVDDICHPLPRPTARIGLGRRARRPSVDVVAVDRQFGA